MADGIVVVQPDSTGKAIDTEELTVSGRTVERQRVRLAGAGAADLVSVDPTFGALRMTPRPMEALGFYALSIRTGTYATTTAGSILFSFRWGDATRLAVILKAQVSVFASGTITAGMIERRLVPVRSFSAPDTGGTAIVPSTTAGGLKLRASFPTSLVSDIRFGPANVAAGTGTPDAQAPFSAPTWIAAAGQAIGVGGLPAILLDATDGGCDPPLVLTTNEGFRIQFGTAADTASTRETLIQILWAEVTSY